jgi:hypothetical protein
LKAKYSLFLFSKLFSTDWRHEWGARNGENAPVLLNEGFPKNADNH